MDIGIVGLIVLGLIVGGVIALYNRLVRLRNQVRNAWRQIDVQLKRRHDLIPNLVETVRDYMGYEQETLEKVVEARTNAVRTEGQGPAAVQGAEQALSGALGRLFALMENYPDLKANENVGQLMEELTTTENRIGFARQFYNDSVMSLNNAVETFPSNLIANAFGFTTDSYFEVDTHAREVPAVNLR